MKDLNDVRKDINEIDKEMAKLFCKRMSLSKSVAEYKKENSIPIFDENRENMVVENNLKLIENEELKPYYVNYIKSVMNISKQYQRTFLKGLRIAYCGIQGSFGYVAANKMYPNCELVSSNNFTNAYKLAEDGECDRVVLPLENSFAGDIGEVMDLIFQGSLYINRMYDLEVEHSLLGLPSADISDINTVISHPQALEQCSKFIEENGFKIQEDVNTAFAARRLKELNDKKFAVIASRENADIYGLKVLKDKINTSEVNKTRFAAFSKRHGPAPRQAPFA